MFDAMTGIYGTAPWTQIVHICAMATDTPERQIAPALQTAPQGRTHRVTAHARKCFIEALCQTGNVAEACRRSGNPGFSRKHAYRIETKTRPSRPRGKRRNRTLLMRWN